jgi:plastocyanin
MKVQIGTLVAIYFAGIGLSGSVFAADVTVTGLPMSWDTPVVAINQGDTVTWTNMITTHNVVQSANAASNVYDGSGFNSGAIGAVNTFQHTFVNPGFFYFICESHVAQGMKGAVVVTAVPMGPPAMPTQSNTLLYVLGSVLAAVGIAFMGKRLFLKN